MTPGEMYTRASLPDRRNFLWETSRTGRSVNSGRMVSIRFLSGSGKNRHGSGAGVLVVPTEISAGAGAGSVHMPRLVIFQPKIHSVLLSRRALSVHRIIGRDVTIHVHCAILISSNYASFFKSSPVYPSLLGAPDMYKLDYSSKKFRCKVCSIPKKN